MLDQIRIVMIHTTHPGNIGGVARAMQNMGLTDLCLVAPKRFPDPEADARASGATDLLASARVVESLEEALEDCHLVVGTSARERHIPWPVITLGKWPRWHATCSRVNAWPFCLVVKTGV
ncbi:RNA methyltransferase [Nitrincola sp. A-D6]|uniref:RNA methyltransferase n=1 Tax=Nitrincola sp. A-D6 TaxID=1545442 RepID=UPI000B247830